MKNVRDPKYIDGEETLSKALKVLMDNKTAVFVIKNGRYVGLIDDRNISKGISDSSNVRCINCAVRTPTLYDDSDVEETLDAFLSGKYKALPVLDKKTNRLIGSLTKVELIAELMNSGLIPNASVGQFMKKPVYSVEYTSSIGNARKELKNKRVHKLLVTERGRPRGIISTFDLSALLLKPRKRDRAPIISEVRNLDKNPVSEIVRGRIVSVEMDIPLFEAMRTMVKKGVSNLLITRGNSPVGVLSSTDVFKSVKSSVKKKGWNISVSGLSNEEDERFYPMVRERFEALVERYSKNFNIQRVAIHIKKKKSMYEVKARIKIDGKITSFSYNWHELGYLMDYLIREIKKVLNKRKSKKTEPKRRKRAPKRRFSKKRR